MPSRPQFSLRLLLFVTVMVCLAAATVRQPPEDRGLATACQTTLRLTVLITLPAIFLIGAIQAREHVRAFCIGTLFPMAIPPMIVCHESIWSSIESANLRELVRSVWSVVEFEPHRTALFWALAPLGGLVCIAVETVSTVGIPRLAPSPMEMVRRLVVAAFLTAALAAGVIALPDAGSWLEGVTARPLMAAACLPSAVLVLYAVRSRGYFRSFCVGSVLPTVFVLPAMCQEVIWDVEPEHRWIFYVRYFVVAMWALAPCVGLAAVCFHWLFQFGKANDKDRGNPAE